MAERKDLLPWEKHDLLVDAVLTKTPSEVAELYKSLGKMDFTAYVLGLACRYRGLDMVKVLVEGGAEFPFELKTARKIFGYYVVEGANYASALLSKMRLDRLNNNNILPLGDRLEILDYLCGTADKTGLDKDELLYYAVLNCELEITERLKKAGAVIPQALIKVVTEGGKDDWGKEKWNGYCGMTEALSNEEYMACMPIFVSELGGRKLHFTERTWSVMLEQRHNAPGFFKFFIENFDMSKANKGKLMKSIIENDSTDALAVAAELGWLKQAKKRDEMIAFASESGKTECTAWLLDFKNRTADFAAERAKAEKKAERELNADPNSPTELKKVWDWAKRENGDGLVITGYKGDKTEITVPEKIGEDIVTVIGEYAFSPDAKRIKAEQRELRKVITEVKLPDTVTEIGEFAFFKCGSLTHFNVPPRLAEIPKGAFQRSGIKEIVIGGNVKKICWGAFYNCNDLKTAALCEGVEEIEVGAFYALETIEMPMSVTKLADDWIHKAREVTVILHKGSYAEEYCTKKKIPFKYKE